MLPVIDMNDTSKVVRSFSFYFAEREAVTVRDSCSLEMDHKKQLCYKEGQMRGRYSVYLNFKT